MEITGGGGGLCCRKTLKDISCFLKMSCRFDVIRSVVIRFVVRRLVGRTSHASIVQPLLLVIVSCSAIPCLVRKEGFHVLFSDLKVSVSLSGPGHLQLRVPRPIGHYPIPLVPLCSTQISSIPGQISGCFHGGGGGDFPDSGLLNFVVGKKVLDFHHHIAFVESTAALASCLLEA